MSDTDPFDVVEDDPILAEIRQMRNQQAARFGYDDELMLEFSRRTRHLWRNDVVQRAASGDFVVVHKGSGRMDLDAIRAIEREIANRVPKHD